MDQFANAYLTHFNKVRCFLLNLTGDEHIADELTQETFFQALLHIERYTEQGSMLTWLCTIAKNLWYNEWRRRKKFAALDSADTVCMASPEERVLSLDRQKAMCAAVMELPEDYRDLVILHIYGEQSLKDISCLKGKSESWGKVTYYRAKQLLKKTMEAYDG